MITVMPMMTLTITSPPPAIVPLLDSAQAGDGRVATGHAADFEHEEAHKVAAGPVAAVGAEHVQILNFQRSAVGREKEVELAVLKRRELFSPVCFGVSLQEGGRVGRGGVERTDRVHDLRWKGCSGRE